MEDRRHVLGLATAMGVIATHVLAVLPMGDRLVVHEVKPIDPLPYGQRQNVEVGHTAR